MLQSIEIEIDANGFIHTLEPLPAGRRGILTLLDDVLFEKNKTPKIEKQTIANTNHFDDLFGIVTATRHVSLEEMEQAIAQNALERFNDCD